MNKGASFFKKAMANREFNILLLVVFVIIVMSFASPNFLTVRNFMTIGINLSVDSILLIGMTIVLSTGGIDLSIGSILGLSCMVAGIFHVNLGMDIWLSSLLAIVISGILGVINGFMIGKVRITPLIVTLSMMGMARGLTYIFTEGASVAVPKTTAAFLALGKGAIMGVPIIIIIAVVLLVIFDILTRKMLFFRKMYYCGSNEKATMLSGINVIKTKMNTYVLNALLCGIAGVLTLARFTVATPKAGLGAEMRIISACVIGGASLNGGVGTVVGSLSGLILLSIVNNSLILLDVSIYWQDFISGAILLLAVTIDQVTRRRDV